MDDMFFQCNKDAIYVLNSSYAYGEFSHLNLFGAPGSNVLQTPRGNNCPTEGLYRSKSLCGSTPVPEPTASQRISSATLQKLFRSSHNEKQSHQESKQFQSQQNFAKCKTNSTAMTTKKCSSVKSAIIAKKTKFWKYLEEEKWKKSSLENLSTTNTDPNSGVKLTRNHSAGSNNNTRSTSDNNNYNSSSPRAGGAWNGNSSSNNSNNNNNNSSKSSTELYREAAQLLGLSCTLCDNCRCLDCQSRYFECDDSDSFSEISFVGDLYYDLPQGSPANSNQCPSASSHCHSQSTAECTGPSDPESHEPLSDLSTDDAEICEKGATR